VSAAWAAENARAAFNTGINLRIDGGLSPGL